MIRLFAHFVISLCLAQAVCGQGAENQGAVQNGVDVLIADRYAQLRGQRVGLITNHTGITRDGSSIVDVFAAQREFELAALFSPEHGFHGTLDQAKIDDATHASTGLKIHSLYGETRVPTPAMLEGLDTLVFDIQDIGCRFYTYISTMKGAMEAAAAHDKRFVVLDRLNPIGGDAVLGPVLDAGLESFVGCHTIPVQHGMTVGELARLLAAELRIDVKLEIVECRGWRRSMLFDASGLLWVNPSPNMRTLNQALLYPGVGLLETTNVSVGRGTDTPFEIVGAPWIEPQKLHTALMAHAVPGVVFVPLHFVPNASKFEGERCGGVQILVTDRARLDALQVGMVLATTLHAQFGEAWQDKGYARLLCDADVLEGVRAGWSPERLESAWGPELAAFMQRRAKHLIYD